MDLVLGLVVAVGRGGAQARREQGRVLSRQRLLRPLLYPARLLPVASPVPGIPQTLMLREGSARGREGGLHGIALLPIRDHPACGGRRGAS
jgi:hypothetical protein